METRAQRIRRQKERQLAHSRRAESIWNSLSVVILLGMSALVVVFALVYFNPGSSINPFPPPTLVSAVFIPSTTPTLPLPTTTPFLTNTPFPTDTPAPLIPTMTFTVSPVPTETATEGPTPTSTVYSVYPYIMDTTSVISGETFHAGEGCKLWVAGQTLDLKRAPIVGITVQLGGYLQKTISQFSLTGTALQYGQAGYEFTIADETSPSTHALWVQLLDQTGIPLSARIYFDTFDDCQKNLILINFRQVK